MLQQSFRRWWASQPGWLRDRTAATLALSVVLLLLVGVVRWHSADRNFDRHYLERFTWGSTADVVLGGDSRTHIGVSPEILSDHLGVVEARNFAFNGAGFTPEYLDGIERVLSAGSKSPAILLGVTPRSLTPAAAQKSGFDYYRQRASAWELLKYRHLDPVFQFFAPVNVAELKKSLGVASAQAEQAAMMYDDGWKAVSVDSMSEDHNLRGHRDYYATQQVQPDAIAHVMQAVQRWSQAGISVYGFRPPSCAEMIALENELSGFDEAGFAASFEQAGGIWLKIPGAGYYTYDGSHLERESAELLSRELAFRVAAADAYLAERRTPDRSPAATRHR